MMDILMLVVGIVIGAAGTQFAQSLLARRAEKAADKTDAPAP